MMKQWDLNDSGPKPVLIREPYLVISLPAAVISGRSTEYRCRYELLWAIHEFEHDFADQMSLFMMGEKTSLDCMALTS